MYVEGGQFNNLKANVRKPWTNKRAIGISFQSPKTCLFSGGPLQRNILAAYPTIDVILGSVIQLRRMFPALLFIFRRF